MTDGRPDPFPFIVGSGRSGTTLLRSMFNAHPDVAIPDESHFVVTMARARRRYEAPGGFRTDLFLEDLGGHWGFRGWGLDVGEVAAELEANPPASLPEALRRVYGRYALSRGKRHYGDKTPIYVLHLAVLAGLFPEARILHVVRDGRDVALSFLDQDFGPRSVAEAAVRWKRWVGRGRAGGGRLGPERYREVRYEDLVADPEAALRELSPFVGVGFHERMLRYFEPGRVEVERHYYRSVRLPPTADLRAWRRDMAPGDVRTFEALAGGVLSDLGYERAHPRLGPAARGDALLRWAGIQAVRAGRRLTKGARRRPRRPGQRLPVE